jgi:hypothetical protein
MKSAASIVLVVSLVALALPAVAQERAGVASGHHDRAPASIDKTFEREALKKRHGRGMLIDVHAGNPDEPITIAVHGIRGGPSTLTQVMQKQIDAGNTVKAFVYDDKFRSLEDSSRDLATSIELEMDRNSSRKLRLDAHSMGGRVALGALSILKEGGRLTGDIVLNLMASPIAGMKSANFSLMGPGFIPWIRPIHGIAPASKYQRLIDGLRLPDNVEVNVFVGGKDEVFTYATTQYRDLVEHLHGTLMVFPDATHMSILDEVARLR